MSYAGEKFKWQMTAANTWETFRAHRGYTATITYVEGTGYTLAIVGDDAPADVDYDTLRQAKNAFRKFLLDK